MAMRPESWLSIPPDGDDEEATLAMADILALSMIANSEGIGTVDPTQTDELTEAAPDLIPEWVETLHKWRSATIWILRRSRRFRPRLAETSRALRLGKEI